MVVETFLAFLSKIFCFTSFVAGKNSFPQPLSASEEKRCVELVKEGDLVAREKLIRHNLRLVAHVVKKYHSAGEADDLISVGSIGLIKGIETFEYGKGSQLATYCAKCIDNEILMYIRANKKHKAAVSLSESVGTDKDGNEITLMDILPCSGETVTQKVESEVLYGQIIALMDKTLTRREKTIICYRYGIGVDRLTQSEIAEKLRISRSYVSRIEKRALSKLQKEFAN